MAKKLSMIWETEAGAIDVTEDIPPAPDTEADRHYCDELKRIEERRINGEFNDSALYGMAVMRIEYGAWGNAKIDESPRRGWVAHNDEYGTFIKFCPFCGEKLEATTP